MNFLSLLLVLSTMSIPAEAATIHIKDDYGGNVFERAVEIDQHKNDQMIISGICYSSCTMYLLKACVNKNARLGFHGAYDPHSGKRDKMSNQILAGMYPPKIAKKFREQWYKLGPDELHVISGKEAIKLGAKAC